MTLPAVSLGVRDVAHRREPGNDRALCGRLTSPVAPPEDPCGDDDLAEEARAAAKLPDCPTCKSLDIG